MVIRRIEGGRDAFGAGVLAIALVIALAVLNPGSLAFSLREYVFDKLISEFPRTGASQNIVVVDIDSNSIAKKGAWPWSRSQLAELLEKIAAQKPRAIAVNILFDGPDRSSARSVISRIARDDKRPDLLSVAESFPDADARLARAADADIPIIFALGIEGATRKERFPPLILATAQDAPVHLMPVRVSGLAGPPAAVRENAAGLGVLALDTDIDGWLRRFPLILEMMVQGKGQLFAGLALETVRAAEGAGTVVYDTRERRLEAGSISFATPDDSLMRFYPRPQDYWADKTVPAATILDGGKIKVDENTIVIVGSSAPQAGAYLPSAVSGAVSTLFAQAEAIDLLLSKTALRRATGAPWSEWLAAVAMGLLAVAACVLFPPFGAALSVAGLIALSFGVSALAFIQGGMLIDATPAAGAVILAAGAASLSIHNRIRTNRALVEARFSRYLAPTVVAILARDPKRLRIEAVRREITALFTDLEGFTPFGERTPPAQLISTLNEYFELIAKVVVDHGGMVDKIVGDAVHVFFNMPLDQPDHAERAVNCARAIRDATERYRQLPRQAELGLGRTRVGVDTGWATVGDVGGRDKLDYTAHGEAVNRAARLQSMARDFPSGVLIGESTVQRLASRQGLTSAGKLTPRGLSQEQEVFTFG